MEGMAPRTQGGAEHCVPGNVYMNPLYVDKDSTSTHSKYHTTKTNVLKKSTALGVIGCLYTLTMTLIVFASIEEDKDSIFYKGVRFEALTIVGVMLMLMVGIVELFLLRQTRAATVSSKGVFFVLCTLMGLYFIITSLTPPPQIRMEDIVVPTRDTGECTAILGHEGYLLPCLKSTNGEFKVVKQNKNVTKQMTIKEVDTLLRQIFVLTGFEQVANFQQEDNICTEGKVKEPMAPFQFVAQLLCHHFIQPCDNTCTPYPICRESVCEAFFSNTNCQFIRKADGEFFQIINKFIEMLADTDNLHIQMLFQALELHDEHKPAAFAIIESVISLLQEENMESCMRNAIFGPQVSECYDTKTNQFKSNRDIKDGKCAQTSLERSKGTTEKNALDSTTNVFPYQSFAMGLATTILAMLSSRDIFTARGKTDRLCYKQAPMTTRSKQKIVGSSVLSFIVGLAMFYHGSAQTRFYRLEKEKYGGALMMSPYTVLFFAVSAAASSSSVAQLMAAIGGTVTVAEVEKDNVSRKTRFKAVRKFVRRYYSLFGYREGNFFIQKLIIFEFIELIVQLESLDKLSRNGNLFYTGAASVLLLLNVVVAPMLFLVRHRLKRISAKYAIVIFDTVLDCLYFCNNLYRGGESITSLENDFFVNMAVVYPSVSILLRARTVYRALAFERKSKYGDPLPSLSTPSINLFRPSRSPSHRKRQWTTIRLSYFEVPLYVSMACLGASGGALFIAQFAQQYRSCQVELTEVLWNVAEPKKMFPKGIFEPPECGYEKIKSIVADNKGVSTVPAAIGRCSSLEVLGLADNAITNLPSELLTHGRLQTASVKNNPVAKRINLSYMEFGTNPVFPPRFLCKFVPELEIVHAEGAGITRISKCIGKFLRLEVLRLAGNVIVEDGISSEILSLNDTLVDFDVTGNPVWKRLSFRNEDIKDKPSKDTEHLKHFVVKYFPALESLDVSHNHIRDNTIFIEILDHCNSLQTLNVSSNNIETLLADTGNNCAYQFYGNWPALQVLDASSNQQLARIVSNTAGYFQNRAGNATLLLQNNRVKVVAYWHNGFVDLPTVVFDQLNLVEVFWIHKNKKLQVPKNLSYFCRFRSLKQIQLDAINPKTKTIPSCFRHLKSFRVVGSETANFSWPYDVFSTNSSIQELVFTGSKLLAQRWKSFPNFEPGHNLADLRLDRMGLKAVLPKHLDKQVPRLKLFSARNNILQGPIPAWNFSSMKYLDLSDNVLSGDIPGSVLTLEQCYFQKNANLTGSLPPLHPDSQLYCLDVRGTKLGGHIPQSYFRRTGEFLLPLPGFNRTSVRMDMPSDSTMECHFCVHDVTQELPSDTCVELVGNSTAERLLLNPASEDFDEYIWCHSKLGQKKFCRLSLEDFEGMDFFDRDRTSECDGI
jgi:Leucine-rich repeat (LRR) protein